MLPFAITQMNLERVMLSEMSQTEKDEYCALSYVDLQKARLIES